jgi:hypothetical protein
MKIKEHAFCAIVRNGSTPPPFPTPFLPLTNDSRQRLRLPHRERRKTKRAEGPVTMSGAEA